MFDSETKAQNRGRHLWRVFQNVERERWQSEEGQHHILGDHGLVWHIHGIGALSGSQDFCFYRGYCERRSWLDDGAESVIGTSQCY